MADEAAITTVIRMRDEASAQLKGFGQNIQQQEIQALQFNVALISVGSALSAMGGLMNQIESPMAKMGAKFLMTAGAVFTTTSAIIQMMPAIRGLIGWLRNLAIAQALVQALSGPAGWVTLGAGLAIAGAATAGIYAATGGFNKGGGGTTVNINGPVMGNPQQAKQLARQIGTNLSEDTRLGR